MWALSVDSSMLFSMARTSFSDNFYISSSFNLSEEESFFFGSTHLQSIPKDNPKLAYYRAKSLLNLLNGSLLLSGDLTVGYYDEIIWVENGRAKRCGSWQDDIDIEEYKELVDPFDSSISNKVPQKHINYLTDYLWFAREDPLVRQSIQCLWLSKRDSLYFLTNVYKIYENILKDLDIPKNRKEYKKVTQSDFPKDRELIEHLDELYYGDFGHFVNSAEGSGILSRHGGLSEPYKGKDSLNLKELDSLFRDLINYWIRRKIREKFGVTHNTVYRPLVMEIMKDSDYDYDLK